MADSRERYGRLFNERGRLTVNAEREKPFHVEGWEGRTEEQKEIDMRGASAVATRAVHDADAECADLRAEVLLFRMHLPAALDALRKAVADAEYAARGRRFRATLEAWGGGEKEGPRS